MGRNIEFQRSTLGAAASRLQPALALIEQLQGGSRLRLNWTEIRLILDQLTNGHFWIGYPLPSGYAMFRGRVNAADRFENIRQLSFRPSEDVRDYGRCHRPGLSVFYGSNNLEIYRFFVLEITDCLGFGIYGRKIYARSVKIAQDGSIEWEN